ncbi:hypothetical protein BC826DRAFT_986315, partial [Russula brevipes]
QFIGRAKGLKPYKVARVAFTAWAIQLSLTEPLPLTVEIMCGDRTHWKFSLLLSLVERLDIAGYVRLKPREEDYLDFSQFFHHLPPSGDVIESRATGVLPNLRDIFLGGSTIPGTVPEAMQPFVDARRLSGQPITIHRWEEQGADL